ncbi:MAG TPA: tetratricopeptide repeat protein, partial [Anaerolineales bacterium]|nr:tetratricopeptide repeat protein [Anaerolineales bacterium]
KQEKYKEAIDTYEEALPIFEKQHEPKSIASIWHQIGIVHQEAGNYESAEAAYRRSLEIKSQNNDRAGQANSLINLGVLYNDKLNRPEEAVVFYRQSADIYVEIGDLRYEGFTRNNIANTLQQLKRYDEARAEIMRAIECKSQIGLAAEPWKSFDILHNIEESTGNSTAARAAWEQARDAYLAYRRQGGYASQGAGGQFIDQILGLIQQGKSDEIQNLLNQYSDAPDYFKKFMQIVVDILNGSRDKALGDDPALSYSYTAEVLFLIERLGG